MARASEVGTRETGPTPGRATRVARAVAGPVLIVAAVLVVLNHFAFGGLISRQYPDVLPFWLPTYCFLGKSLAAGHVPGWNPHVMGGVPFAADPQSGWMYVTPTLLFTFLRCDVAIRWFVVVQPLIGGLGLYGFLRSERCSRVASTAGGMALAMPLAGSYLSLNLPFAATLAWTAVTLVTVSRLVQARTWPGRLGWLALAALAWMQIAASNLSDGVVIGTSAIGAYLVARLIVDVRRGERTARGALGLVGLIVVAFPLVDLAYLLPRLAYLPRTSIALGYRALYLRHRALAGRRVGLEFGTGVGITWPLRLALAPGAYLGATALGLMFAVWRATGRRFLLIAFAAYGAVSYVLMLQPVAAAMPEAFRRSSIGGFYFHDPSRFRFGLLIALAVLAGVGVQGWLDARTWRERLLLALPGAVVWGVLPKALGAGTVDPLLWYGAAGGGVALLVAVWKPPLAALVPVVLAAELTANGLLGQVHDYQLPPGSAPGDPLHGPINTLLLPTVRAAAYVHPSALARDLRAAGLGRYLSSDPSIWDPRGYHVRQRSWYWGLLGMQQSMLAGPTPAPEEAQGYNPAQELRYWSFLRAVESKDIRYNAAAFVHPPRIALDLLQVRWIVARTNGRGPPLQGSVPVLRDGHWTLWSVPGPSPRASVLSSWRVTPSADAALGVVRSRGFDPSAQVVLERSPGIAPSAGSTDGRASYRWDGTEAAEVQVAAPAPSVVLIRNTYDPDWHATVDGRPAPVVPADAVDQGVAVPAGRHTIRLTYDDPWIGYGVLGSALALLALAVLAAVLGRRERRVPDTGPGPEVGTAARPE